MKQPDCDLLVLDALDKLPAPAWRSSSGPKPRLIERERGTFIVVEGMPRTFCRLAVRRNNCNRETLHFIAWDFVHESFPDVLLRMIGCDEYRCGLYVYDSLKATPSMLGWKGGSMTIATDEHRLLSYLEKRSFLAASINLAPAIKGALEELDGLLKEGLF